MTEPSEQEQRLRNLFYCVADFVERVLYGTVGYIYKGKGKKGRGRVMVGNPM